MNANETLRDKLQRGVEKEMATKAAMQEVKD
jgi:hypothetical protein